jgi:2-polyprenyl-3-methyl-5-hydroxy-6-metoxy-1,4-benzoquinol methylase
MDDVVDQVKADYRVAYELGETPAQKVGWKNEEVQDTRFRVLNGALDRIMPAPGTVLDVGCGYGGLQDWFLQPGYEYTGIDITGQFIHEAIQRNDTGSFMMGDIMDPMTVTLGQYDFVVASGLFHHYPHYHINRALKHMWSMTKMVMAFNATLPNTFTNAHDVVTMINAVGIEKWVMRLDYMDGDVTVYGYK